MPEPVQNVWRYQTGGFISSIVITADGHSIIAGSDDKRVYCFNRNGSLRWWHEVAGVVFSLTLAEYSQRILAGCSSGTAYLWGYNGKLIREYETDGSDIRGAAITPDARLVVLGTQDGSIFFYEEETCRWTYKLGGAVRRISMTEDGNFIAVGSEDHSIYLFNQRGIQLWDYKTDNTVWAGVQIVAGSYVAAGSNDHHLYLLDLHGNLLWKRDTGSFVHVIAAPPDGRCIAAAGASGTVYLYSFNGELLWSYKTGGGVYVLAVSADSRFVVAGSNDHHVYLLDAKGNCIWQQNTQREVFSLAITPDGQLLAAGSRNHILYLFKNIATSSNDFIPWTTRVIIRRVRTAYTSNPHLGMVSWLDEFDHALFQKDFVSCQLLLAEIRQQGYQFTAREQRFIDSREAALLLCQGIHHHYLHEYDTARQYYEASYRLHRTLDNPGGQGQVMLALDELSEQPVEPDNALLEQLMAEPNVLGNSETLLTLRLETLPLAEQALVILAAKQSGHYAPLQKGLLSEEAAVQAASATAMSWLRPGPTQETLVDSMLTSPNWLVRWQAIDILRRQAREDADSFTQPWDRIHQALSEQLEGNELDPMVRRNAALLLLQEKDAADTPVLLRLLIDPDPDVRYAAVKALDALGDRRAIFVLQQVVDGCDFAGNYISNAAKSAIQSIQQRLLVCTVSKVTLCRDLADQEQPAQAQLLFLAQEPPRYCVVTIATPVSAVPVTCSIYRQKNLVFQQQQMLTDIPQEEGEEDLIELIGSPLEGDPQPPSQVVRHSSPEESDASHEMLTWMIQSLKEFMTPPAGRTHADARQRLRQSILEQVSRENEARLIRNSYVVIERTWRSILPEAEDDLREIISDIREMLEDDRSEKLFMAFQDLTGLALELIDEYTAEALALARFVANVTQSFEMLNGGNIQHWGDALTDLVDEYEPAFDRVSGAFGAYFDLFIETQIGNQVSAARTKLRASLYDLLDAVGEDFLVIINGEDEQEREEKDQERFGHLSFFFPFMEMTLSPGDYLVEIALNNMVEVQRSFKISAQVTIKRAVTCLAYNSAGEPADETTTFTVGETIHCSVFLEHAPIGLELRAQLYDAPQSVTEAPQKTAFGDILMRISSGSLASSSALSSKSQLVKTKAEGQQAVTFSWETATRLPGTYAIEITMAEMQTDCVLHVLLDATTSLVAQDAQKFWLEQGESSYHAHRYGKALAAYEQALYLDSTSAPAWAGKGKALHNLNRYEEALTAYELALPLDAQPAQTYTEKGWLLFSLNRYKEALTAFEQAIHLDSSFLRAYVGKGVVLFEADEDCSTVMKEVLALFDRNGQFNAFTYNYQGIALDCLNRLEEALVAYKQAASLDPLGGYIYSNQGSIYKQLGYYDEALAAYEQAIHCNPHLSSSYRGKGDVLVYYNRLEEALASYEQSARLNPFSAYTLTAKSTALMLLGRFDEAQQAFEAAQALKARKLRD